MFALTQLTRFTGQKSHPRPPFILKPSLTMEYLVVAGGGAGGAHQAGGGGGGGLVYNTNHALLFDVVYTISVGAGGPMVSSGLGYNGTDSTFGTITAKGGGGGGYYQGGASGSGGSSGGQGDNINGTTSLGTANQTLQAGDSGTYGFGNAGGAAPSHPSAPHGAGGGGGAGAAGNPPPTQATSGTGGAGKAVSITGSSVYYAGGGGGASSNSAAGGLGGGGQGNDAYQSYATQGTDLLGGGGGANAHQTGAPYGSGRGGNGIVILAFPSYGNTVRILSGTYTTGNRPGFSVYSFSTSGSLLIQNG